MTLQEETDLLEGKKSALQNEITLLQQQREELEFLLATHKAVCTRASKVKSTIPSVIVTTSSMRNHNVVHASMHQTSAEESRDTSICVKEENISDSEENYGNSLFGSIIPSNGPNVKQYIQLTTTASSTYMPSNSLKDRLIVTTSSNELKPSRPTSLAVAPLTDIGVSIETPSSGLRGLNFESMMDGGTGLTPVTPLNGVISSMSTGLTPLTTPIMAHPSASAASTSSANCGYQLRSSSSELSSPDSMTSKHLVSL